MTDLKQRHTDKLLKLVDSLNAYLQQKDPDVIISDYQFVLLRLAYHALVEVSSTTQGFHSFSSLQEIDKIHRELETTNLEADPCRFVDWIKPSKHDQHSIEINMLDCTDLLH